MSNTENRVVLQLRGASFFMNVHIGGDEKSITNL